MALSFTLTSPYSLYGQVVENPEVEPQEQEPTGEHAPTRAAMLSAVLPGMGQVYNGRYWKVPIIYAGFAGVVYAVNFNNTEYQFLRNAYIAKVDGNPNTIDPFPNVEAYRLEREMNRFRRFLEISYIAGAALYLLNILDASVDAHLLDFDVGDELTIRMEPHLTPIQGYGHKNTFAGLKMTFRF